MHTLFSSLVEALHLFFTNSTTLVHALLELEKTFFILNNFTSSRESSTEKDFDFRSAIVVLMAYYYVFTSGKNAVWFHGKFLFQFTQPSKALCNCHWYNPETSLKMLG